MVAGSFVGILKPAFGHLAGLAIPNHDLSGETIDDRVTYFETFDIVVAGIIVITSLRFFGFEGFLFGIEFCQHLLFGEEPFCMIVGCLHVHACGSPLGMTRSAQCTTSSHSLGRDA